MSPRFILPHCRAAIRGPALLGLLLLASLGSPVHASGISVTPTRVDLDEDTRIVALTLRNRSPRDIDFEIELAEWTQSDEGDVYQPTSDLLATPPIFTLPAGEQQVIRVGLRRPLPAGQEHAYRIFIQELPGEDRQRINGLRMLLRLSLPVFVQPSSGTARADLAWKLAPTEHGATGLTLHNAGNGHAKLSAVRLAPSGRKIEAGGMFYVLAGTTRRLQVESGPSIPPEASVHALVNGQQERFDLGSD